MSHASWQNVPLIAQQLIIVVHRDDPKAFVGSESKQMGIVRDEVINTSV
jgi:hypothetical protein